MGLAWLLIKPMHRYAGLFIFSPFMLLTLR
jgi:hypothetical protein